MASKLVCLRRLSTLIQKSGYPFASTCYSSKIHHSRRLLQQALRALHNPSSSSSSSSYREFCSRPLDIDSHSQGPASIDYSSLLREDEFHMLADSTIHSLQEKFEEYGDVVQIDGFDIDYGNEVLTVKLGDLGTYVLNKQTPNRQLWLSSPVSGPSRFDWDRNAQAWVYRRTKEHLLKILETELEQQCGEPIKLT